MIFYCTLKTILDIISFKKNYEKFSFEKPKQNTGTERDGLGRERIKDPEKAHLMASLEHLAYEQANAYEHYLEKPEAHTVEENVEFSVWEASNFSPTDIKAIGAEQAEIAGKKYDIEQTVQEYEEKKSRFGLAKEQIKAGFNIAFIHIKIAFRWGPSLLGFKEPRGSDKVAELRHFFQNFDLESYRFLVADEAVRNLGKMGRREYTADTLGEEAKEALSKAEKYKLPEAPRRQTQFQPEQNKTGGDKGNGEKDKLQAQNREESQGVEGEQNEVVADTFDWIYKKYKEYLSLPKEERQKQSYFFRNLEEKEVSSVDLQDQEKAINEWLERLKVYGKRLENFTEDELRREMKFSFLTSVTKQIFKDEKKSDTEVLFDLGVALFKTYKAARELEKKKGPQTS